MCFSKPELQGANYNATQKKFNMINMKLKTGNKK